MHNAEDLEGDIKYVQHKTTPNILVPLYFYSLITLLVCSIVSVVLYIYHPTIFRDYEKWSTYENYAIPVLATLAIGYFWSSRGEWRGKVYEDPAFGRTLESQLSLLPSVIQDSLNNKILKVQNILKGIISISIFVCIYLSIISGGCEEFFKAAAFSFSLFALSIMVVTEPIMWSHIRKILKNVSAKGYYKFLLSSSVSRCGKIFLQQTAMRSHAEVLERNDVEAVRLSQMGTHLDVMTYHKLLVDYVLHTSENIYDSEIEYREEIFRQVRDNLDLHKNALFGFAPYFIERHIIFLRSLKVNQHGHELRRGECILGGSSLDFVSISALSEGICEKLIESSLNDQFIQPVFDKAFTQIGNFDLKSESDYRLGCSYLQFLLDSTFNSVKTDSRHLFVMHDLRLPAEFTITIDKPSNEIARLFERSFILFMMNMFIEETRASGEKGMYVDDFLSIFIPNVSMLLFVPVYLFLASYPVRDFNEGNIPGGISDGWDSVCVGSAEDENSIDKRFYENIKAREDNAIKLLIRLFSSNTILEKEKDFMSSKDLAASKYYQVFEIFFSKVKGMMDLK